MRFDPTGWSVLRSAEWIIPRHLFCWACKLECDHCQFYLKLRVTNIFFNVHMLNKEKEDLNLIYNAFIGGIDQPQGCYRYK